MGYEGTDQENSWLKTQGKFHFPSPTPTPPPPSPRCAMCRTTRCPTPR